MTEDYADGALVKVQKVDKIFKRGSEEIHVLGGLDLEIPNFLLPRDLRGDRTFRVRTNESEGHLMPVDVSR